MSDHAKPLPGYLVDRYRSWKALRFEDNKGWYQRLALEGQRPRAMVISCCDSRTETVRMFGAEPGDLFAVRNVANIVPPYARDHAHHGTSAAVEYAVTVLKVSNIVVLGHSNCGGVGACYSMCSGEAPELKDEFSIIGRWVELLQPAYDRVASNEGDRDEKIDLMSREGVLHSLNNLESFPCVQEALDAGTVALHGAWINIATGVVKHYNPSSKTFEPA